MYSDYGQVRQQYTPSIAIYFGSPCKIQGPSKIAPKIKGYNDVFLIEVKAEEGDVKITKNGGHTAMYGTFVSQKNLGPNEH